MHNLPASVCVFTQQVCAGAAGQLYCCALSDEASAVEYASMHIVNLLMLCVCFFGVIQEVCVQRLESSAVYRATHGVVAVWLV